MECDHGMEDEGNGMGYHPEAGEKGKNAQKEVLRQTGQQKKKIKYQGRVKKNNSEQFYMTSSLTALPVGQPVI